MERHESPRALPTPPSEDILFTDWSSIGSPTEWTCP